MPLKELLKCLNMVSDTDACTRYLEALKEVSIVEASRLETLYSWIHYSVKRQLRIKSCPKGRRILSMSCHVDLR